MALDANNVIIGKIAVKVIPDLKGFAKKVLAEITAIEKSLDAIEVEVKIDDKAAVTKAKATKRKLERAIGSIDIRVDVEDQASINTGIRRIDRELQKLREVEINDIKLNERELNAARDLLQEHLKFEVEVDRDSLDSLERAMRKIDTELERRKEVTLSFDVDDDSLRKARREIQDQINDKKAAQIQLELDVEHARREAEDMARRSAQRMVTEIEEEVSRAVVNPRLALRPEQVRKIKRDLTGALLTQRELEQELKVELDPLARNRLKRDLEAITDDIDRFRLDLRGNEREMRSFFGGRGIIGKTFRFLVTPFRNVTNAALNAADAFAGVVKVGGRLPAAMGAAARALAAGAPSMVLAAASFVVLFKVVTGLVAGVASLAGGLIALSGAVVYGLVGTLGGALMSLVAIGSALGPLAVLIPEIGKAFKNNHPLVVGLKDAWSDLRREMRRQVFPDVLKQLGSFEGLLRDITPWMADMGEIGVDMIRSIRREFESARMQELFGKLGDGLERMAKTLEPLLGNLLSGVFGTMAAMVPIGERFSDALNDIIADWSDWVQSDKGQARMVQFFEDAWAAAEDLWSTLKNVSSILGSIFEVGQGDGGGETALDRIAAKTKEWADWWKKPENRKLAADFFEDGLESLDDFYSTLSDTGDLLKEMVTKENIANFQKALDDLGSIIDTMARGVDDAERFVDAMETIGRIGALDFDGLLTSEQGIRFAQDLNTFVEQAKKSIKVSWHILKEEWKTHWSTLIDSAKIALGGDPEQSFAEIGREIVNGVIVGIVEKFVELNEKAREKWNEFISKCKEILGIHSPSTVFADIGRNIVDGLILGFGEMWTSFITGVTEKWDGLVTLIGGKIGEIKTRANEKWNEVKENASTKWDEIRTAAGEKWSGVKTTVSTAADGIKTNVGSAWSTVSSNTSTAWGNVKTWISDKLGQAETTAKSTAGNLSTGVSKKWSEVKDSTSGKFGEVYKTIRSRMSDARTTFSEKATGIMQTGRSRFETVRSVAQEKFQRLRDAVETKMQSAKAAVSSGASQMRGVFDGAGSWLWSAGSKIIGGLISGIRSRIGEVRSELSGLTALIPSWKGPAKKDAKLLTPAGQLIIEGLIEGLQSRFGDVKATLSRLTDDIGGMVIDGPTVGSASVNARRRVLAALADGGDGRGSHSEFNYYAAPGASFSAEEDLFAALTRRRAFGA